MQGLIIKDFVTVKRSYRVVAILILFFVVTGFMQKNGEYLLFIAPIFFTTITITTFAYDTAAKWDIYALSMPVTRKELVLSKYAVALLFSLLGSAVSLLLVGVVCLLKGERFTSDFLIAAWVSLGAGLTIISILLPLIYKFGTEKARLMMFAVFLAPSIASAIASVILTAIRFDIRVTEELITAFATKWIPTLVILSPVFIAVVFGASYLVSRTVFFKKEL